MSSSSVLLLFIPVFSHLCWLPHVSCFTHLWSVCRCSVLFSVQSLSSCLLSLTLPLQQYLFVFLINTLTWSWQGNWCLGLVFTDFRGKYLNLLRVTSLLLTLFIYHLVSTVNSFLKAVTVNWKSHKAEVRRMVNISEFFQVTSLMLQKVIWSIN